MANKSKLKKQRRKHSEEESGEVNLKSRKSNYTEDGDVLDDFQFVSLKGHSQMKEAPKSTGLSDSEEPVKSVKKKKKHKKKKDVFVENSESEVIMKEKDPGGSVNNPSTINNEFREKNNKTKKRKHSSLDVQQTDEIDTLEDEGIECPKKKKKKKKSRQKCMEESENLDGEDISVQVEADSPKKKKKRKHEVGIQDEDNISNKRKKLNKKDIGSDSETPNQDKNNVDCDDSEGTADEAENQQTKVKQKKKKKEKSKNKSKETVSVTTGGEFVAQTKALNYLKTWKIDRKNWHFQKVRQVWLLKHLYDAEMLPKADFDIMLEYMEPMKGHSRQVTVEQAEKLVTQQESEKVDMEVDNGQDEETVTEDKKDESKPDVEKLTPEQYERVRQVLQILV